MGWAGLNRKKVALGSQFHSVAERCDTQGCVDSCSCVECLLGAGAAYSDCVQPSLATPFSNPHLVPRLTQKSTASRSGLVSIVVQHASQTALKRHSRLVEVGWYHDVERTQWGCYTGRKVGTAAPLQTAPVLQQRAKQAPASEQSLAPDTEQLTDQVDSGDDSAVVSRGVRSVAGLLCSAIRVCLYVSVSLVSLCLCVCVYASLCLCVFVSLSGGIVVHECGDIDYRPLRNHGWTRRRLRSLTRVRLAPSPRSRRWLPRHWRCPALVHRPTGATVLLHRLRREPTRNRISHKNPLLLAASPANVLRSGSRTSSTSLL